VAGIGRVEAEPGRDAADVVWRYVSRRTGERQEFARSPVRMFRPLLARWATFSGADPHCGYMQFAVDALPGWPSSGRHRFSLYLCNEPTMAFWFKLYLYCIDGEWPMARPDGHGPPASKPVARPPCH
jgi:hypothetical protein